jgi:hypothetical protein
MANFVAEGARKLNRDAPFFWDPSVLYADVLIFEGFVPNTGNSGPLPDITKDKPTQMLSITRTNNTTWVVSYVVTPDILLGDRLLRDDSKILFTKGVAQVNDHKAVGEILYALTGQNYYIIRFRVGTNVFNSRAGDVSSATTIEDGTQPFFYVSNIIRNTIRYQVANTNPSW